MQCELREASCSTMSGPVVPMLALILFLHVGALPLHNCVRQTVVNTLHCVSSGPHGCKRQRLQPASDPLYNIVADLVVPYGYPLQQHAAYTADGYILGLFRIPFGRKHPRQSVTVNAATRAPAMLPRPVVVLQHGLLDACTGFLMNGPATKSLAFALADAGYDVWLGNARGNTYSRKHTNLTVWDAAFWAFSWDDMAQYDLPATIRKAMQVAGVTSVAYVSHSQGSTAMMAALSSNAWLQQVVRVSVLMAPVAMVKHISSTPLRTLAALGTDGVFGLLGVHEFLPSERVLAFLEGLLCKEQPQLCVNVVAAIAGFNSSHVDQSRMPIYVQHTPAGTSVQNMVHWCQGVRSNSPNKLLRFDYGCVCTTRGGLPQKCNQHEYNGQTEPPQYDLSRVTGPLVLFTGGEDKLVTSQDLEYLQEALPACAVVANFHEPGYQHLDFVWGADAGEKVYNRIVDVVRRYD